MPSIKGRILLVGNAAASAGLVTAYLVSAGHEVSAATDDRDAVRLVRDQRPDLVLIAGEADARFGADACQGIRALDASLQAPVILIVPERSAEHRVEAREAGADELIVEPLERNDLLLRVESHLRLREVQRRLDDTCEELASLKRRLRSIVD